mgnify:CR=1 FL=1|jgi:hypothetical protein|tara:strand:+ start:704 stop:1150 length:447 start_codon:yes stop_codon:yes gene_type:complete
MMEDLPNEMDKTEEEEIYLRENLTEEDFLNYEPTRDLLYSNFMEKLERGLLEKVEIFYNAERGDMVNSISNMFYYDQQGSFISELNSIIYSHIKPEYNLELIYDNPHIARPLIKNYDDIMNRNKEKEEPKILIKKEDIKSDFVWAKNI